MKAQTRVLTAVKECYSAFEDWAMVAQSVPVAAKHPQIRFYAGRGWEVDGKLYNLTADLVAAEFKRCASHWTKLAKEARIGSPRPA